MNTSRSLWGLQHPGPLACTLLLASLSVLGTVLVLLHQVTWGAALEPDSVTYIAVARNLLAGNGFVQASDGNWYTHWPPLFPSLLALASLFVFDPHEVAGPVNAAAFGLTIFVAGRWLRKSIYSRALLLWGCLAITLSAPLLQNAAWVMSEPVFILFAVLALVETENFLNTEHRSSLIRSALFTALACLTRYIGLSIVITVGLVLLFKSTKPLREKVRHSAAYAFIAVTPLGLWLLRNMIVSGTPTGSARSSPPLASFAEYAQYTLDVLASWAVPVLNPVPVGIATAAGIALLALAIAVAYGFLRSRREAQTRPDWNPLMLFGAFVLIYLAFFLVAASNTPVSVARRHISPAYIPLLFIVTFVLDRWSGRGAGKSPLTAVMAVPLALWLAGSAVVTGRGIYAANGDGSEYFRWSLTSRRFTHPAVLSYLREHPLTGWVYSNDPFAVYIYTTVRRNIIVLHETEQRLVQSLQKCASDPAGFQCDPPLGAPTYFVQAAEAVNEDMYIVWFDGGDWLQHDYGSFHLRALPGVEIVAELADGIILRVTPGHFDVESYVRNKAASLTAIVTAAGEPIIRSHYNVYIHDNRAIYAKDSCSQDDMDPIFFLHLIPADENDLPDNRQQYGFDNLDFRFTEAGRQAGQQCLAIRELPKYALRSIRTGQYVPGAGPIWEGRFSVDE